MKAPHHLTALAMVGWYLMMPSNRPIHQQDILVVYGAWTSVAKFVSADDCQAAMKKLHGQGYRNSLRLPRDYQAVAELSAKCVLKDDSKVRPK
jgi:hypothetical protein